MVLCVHSLQVAYLAVAIPCTHTPASHHGHLKLFFTLQISGLFMHSQFIFLLEAPATHTKRHIHTDMYPFPHLPVKPQPGAAQCHFLREAHPTPEPNMITLVPCPTGSAIAHCFSPGDSECGSHVFTFM